MESNQNVEFESDHACKSTACKCHIPSNDDYCNEFCRRVESSEEVGRCGCGHSDCDVTKQIGNEAASD